MAATPYCAPHRRQSPSQARLGKFHACFDRRMVYTFVMKFEFDAGKQVANLRKHGIDLRDAAYLFLDVHRLDAVDSRKDYGEERRLVIGCVEDRIWVVVYARRADAIRLISARTANEREQKRYHALHS